MNISVPPELKRSMDGVSRPVNWSAVAQQAFRVKVKELAASHQSDTLEGIINRLHAAGEIEAENEFNRGFRAGQTWVKWRAKPREIKRIIGEFCAVWGGPAARLSVREKLTHWSAANLSPFIRLAEILIGSGQISSGTAAEFWNESLGSGGEEDARNPDFACGFIVGVTQIWDAIQEEAEKMGRPF